MRRQATAKKKGDLVKFGGGFYAGKIPAPPKVSSSAACLSALELRTHRLVLDSRLQADNSGWLTSVILALYALVGK